MVRVFYDIFSIIKFFFMQFKFYCAHHWQKYGLQNGSFPYDIGVALRRDVNYTSLEPIKFYFMHFCFFSTLSIWTLSSFRLSLGFYLNYATYFWLIYDICDYLIMDH